MSGIKVLRGAALVICACADLGSFHLSASGLDIGPDPAMPGDQVTATFVVRLAPVQGHTIVLMIDGKEHLRLTSDKEPPALSVVVLGDAADLISDYGLGVHFARVDVSVDDADKSARTQSVSFALTEATP